jgi:hypothetical protein
MKRQHLIRIRNAALGVVLISCLFIFSACNSDNGDTSSTGYTAVATATATTATGTTPTGTTPTTSTTTTTPSGPPFSLADVSGGTEEVMVLSNITVGDHDGYERIVLEFVPQLSGPGTGMPRYRVSEVAPPYTDQGGQAQQVNGSYYLESRCNCNTSDLSQGSAPLVYQGPSSFTPGLFMLQEMKFIPPYENNTVLLLAGLSSQAPFRVAEMSNPLRLVVDVQK